MYRFCLKRQTGVLSLTFLTGTIKFIPVSTRQTLIYLMWFFTAVLSLSTNRSQFFINDGFWVTCPPGWSVYRSTSSKPSPRLCAPPWGKPQATGCRVGPTQSSYTGSYWCQDKDKEECTTAANITVSEKTVILESPFFPVKEGQDVTLSCSYKAEEHHKPTSDFEAAFFRNDTFQGRFPGGKMLLSPVSKAHEGMYKCEHLPSKEQSLESQLIVLSKERPSTIAPTTSPPQPKSISLYRILIFVFLFILYTAILCIGICIYRTWARGTPYSY
uniref:Immunoglobulin domain-containing protein n=1 Tax=Neogobius melanostomus TaxID=47308 RepID=A0A8C6TEY3_9GOBI